MNQFQLGGCRSRIAIRNRGQRLQRVGSWFPLTPNRQCPASSDPISCCQVAKTPPRNGTYVMSPTQSWLTPPGSGLVRAISSSDLYPRTVPAVGRLGHERFGLKAARKPWVFMSFPHPKRGLHTSPRSANSSAMRQACRSDGDASKTPPAPTASTSPPAAHAATVHRPATRNRPTRTHLQNFTHGGQRQPRPPGPAALDRGVHVAYSCRPKIANAFFKMSRSALDAVHLDFQFVDALQAKWRPGRYVQAVPASNGSEQIGSGQSLTARQPKQPSGRPRASAPPRGETPRRIPAVASASAAPASRLFWSSRDSLPFGFHFMESSMSVKSAAPQ